MKKTLGWFLIILSSFFFLILAFVFLTILLSGDTFTHEKESIPSMLIGFGISLAIFFFLFRYGKELIKKTSFSAKPYNDSLSIHIKGKISYKDYRNTMIGIVLHTPVYQIIFVLSILFIIS